MWFFQTGTTYHQTHLAAVSERRRPVAGPVQPANDATAASKASPTRVVRPPATKMASAASSPSAAEYSRGTCV